MKSHPNGDTMMMESVSIHMPNAQTPRDAIVASKAQARKYQDLGGARNFAKAFHAFQTAADLGDAEAQFAVGKYLEEGVGTDKNPRQAVKWFKKAADSDVNALYSLALCYFEGRGVRRDTGAAVTLFQRAARKGDPDAEYALGLAYLRGRGVVRDFEKGFRWLLKAAKRGYAPAQFSVGYSYSNGRGVKRDLAAAEIWYAKAAEQGEADARHNLELLRSQKKQS